MASRLNATEKPGGTGTVPKDPQVLQMKNKAERPRFLFFERGSRAVLSEVFERLREEF